MQQPFRSTVAEFTPLGLDVHNRKPTWDAWSRLFEVCVDLDTATPWALADAYMLGEEAFGEEAAQALVANKISPRRAQRVVRVSRFWRLDSQRAHRNFRRAVSFTHHEAVTGLAMSGDAGFSLACELLDQAELDPGMSSDDLEMVAKRHLGEEEEGKADGEGEPVQFSVGSIVARLERYHRTGDRILADLPEDYTEEHSLLTTALDRVSDCLNSVKNRAVGGDPAALEERAA
jgi:hypothetical protein